MKHNKAFFDLQLFWHDLISVRGWKKIHRYFQMRRCAVAEAKRHVIRKDVVFEVSHLSVQFENNGITKKVIDDFSFQFAPNKIYCLIGASGSGKTTLISHFNGIQKSAKGNLYFKNGAKILFYKNKIKDYKKIRRLLSIVFQSPEHQLFKETVLKDVAFGPKALGLDRKNATINAAKQLLDLGLNENFFNSNPFNLSGGQKRKVALAGIFAINSEVLIFDEPTSGLDPASEAEVIQMFLQLKSQNKTIIVITHNMDHVLEIADEVILLDEGCLVTSHDPFTFFCDKRLLNRYQIVTPHVIGVIDRLVAAHPQFESVMAAKPRTVSALAQSISDCINHNRK